MLCERSGTSGPTAAPKKASRTAGSMDEGIRKDEEGEEEEDDDAS